MPLSESYVNRKGRKKHLFIFLIFA